LGGFFHAIQSPFTGLLLGGLSVIYIGFIADQSKSRVKDLGKALLFVLLVKLAVSPHSPLGAYVAVSMQCAFGMLFFASISNYKAAALATGIASLVSSALQKIIILTIVFGMPLWEAVDKFVLVVINLMDFVQLPENFSASMWLVLLYVVIYFAGGIAVGIVAGNLPGLLQSRKEELYHISQAFDKQRTTAPPPAARRGSAFTLPLIALALAALVFAFDYVFISSETAYRQLIRTVAIIFAWVALLNPLLKYLLGKYLKGKSQAFEDQIAHVRETLPKISAFARFAWRRSRTMKGRWRLLNFILLFIYFGIYEA